MGPKTGNALLAGFLVFTAAGPAWADAGVSGAGVLRQELSARLQGIAGAGAAAAAGADAQALNPAGLARLEQTEIQFLHGSSGGGMDTEWLAGGVAVPDLGSLGAQILMRSQPDIDNPGADEPPVAARDLLFGVSGAGTWAPGLRLGAAAKVLLLTLGPVEASALSLDLGAQYELFPGRLDLGAAVRNLGDEIVFLEAGDPQPLTWVLGAAFRPGIGGENHALQFLADAAYVAPEQNSLLRLGAVYAFREQLTLRLGYEFSRLPQVSHLALGVGFRFQAGLVRLSLDYAARPQWWQDADFELANLLSLSAAF